MAATLKDFSGKVQASGGSGDGSFFAREDGLVPLAVGRGIRSLDVWRQRHMPEAFESGPKIALPMKTDGALSQVTAGYDLRLQAVFEPDTLADLHFTAGPDQGTPVPIIRGHCV